MKKYLLLTILLIFSFNFFAQDVKKISLEYKNLSIEDILNRIETKSDYFFYYDKNWFDSNKLISGNYKNVTIKSILEDIFYDTLINFFIYDNNTIILTKNSIIHKPTGFLREDNIKRIKSNNSPVFYEVLQTNNLNREGVVRIGKESDNTNNDKFILKGYVKDVLTSKPIVNATLQVKNKNINTVTDEKGFYSITLNTGINSILINSLGYNATNKNIIIYNNGSYNFMLSENIEELDELIIETNADKNVKESVTGITRIKMKQIKTIPLILGERDILRVATNVPGISTAGEGASGFNVRGGKVDQNLILLDDAVIYNPSHFFGIFSAINPFTTGEVNIYKGTIPTEFGGRLSSVVELETKTADYNKTSGELSVGPVTGNVSIQSPIIKDKSSIIVGGRATYSNWILGLLEDKNLRQSKASFYDVNAKYTHKINSNNKLETSAYYSNDAFNVTADSVQTYSNRLASLKWSHKFNDKNFGELILANSEYKYSIDFDKNSLNDFRLDYRIAETELKLKMRYLLNKKNKINYGISTKLYNNSPGTISPLNSESLVNEVKIPDEKGLESALFISDEYSITDKLLLNLGVRYSLFTALGPSVQNVYENNLPKSESTVIEELNFINNEAIKTFGGPELRTSLRYILAKDLSLKAGFGNTYQYIHTLSNNTTAAPTDIYRLTNLNIKPQQANQVSLGIFKNIDGNNYELSLETYYKSIKNLVDYKVGANLLLNEVVETEILQGDGQAYGIEFLLRKNKGRLNGWLGYSYSRSFIKLDSEFEEETVNNGNFFPTNFDKPHNINVIANYKLTKRYSFSGNFSYQTGRPVTYTVGSFVFNNSERVLYSQRNKFRIPDYYRLDLGFNVEGNHKRKKIGHSFWNVSVYNVLGRNNPFSVFFVSEDGELKAYQNSIFAIPVPTITYNIIF